MANATPIPFPKVSRAVLLVANYLPSTATNYEGLPTLRAVSAGSTSATYTRNQFYPSSIRGSGQQEGTTSEYWKSRFILAARQRNLEPGIVRPFVYDHSILVYSGDNRSAMISFYDDGDVVVVHSIGTQPAESFSNTATEPSIEEILDFLEDFLFGR